jgi:hypothetical protein
LAATNRCSNLKSNQCSGDDEGGSESSEWAVAAVLAAAAVTAVVLVVFMIVVVVVEVAVMAVVVAVVVAGVRTEEYLAEEPLLGAPERTTHPPHRLQFGGTQHSLGCHFGCRRQYPLVELLPHAHDGIVPEIDVCMLQRLHVGTMRTQHCSNICNTILHQLTVGIQKRFRE